MDNAVAASEYLAPKLPEHLATLDIPVVRATEESLDRYGCLVDDPKGFPIEIVTWPQPGWRALDPGTGNEGGTTNGIFDVWWDGDVLFGKNHAVGSNEYLLGWSGPPRQALREKCFFPRGRLLLWHANYHPDGGQLFFPLDGEPFIAPLALPGDDLQPERFVAFYVDSGRGLYIHPNIWHGAVVPHDDHAEFLDRQGRVHARVSVDFPKEFGCYLAAPMRRP